MDSKSRIAEHRSSSAKRTRSQTGHQRLEPFELFRIDAVTDLRPIDFSLNQSRLFQDFQMLRHRRLSERQTVHDFTANAGLSTDQQPHDLDARGMSDCPSQFGKLVRPRISPKLHRRRIATLLGRLLFRHPPIRHSLALSLIYDER